MGQDQLFENTVEVGGTELKEGKDRRRLNLYSKNKNSAIAIAYNTYFMYRHRVLFLLDS
jgi:hypothetical protein